MRMRKPSFAVRRIVAGVVLLQLVFFITNYYLFRFFEPYDKQLLVASGALAVFFALYVAPTEDELETYRTKKRNASK
jgi:hypothetical protein